MWRSTVFPDNDYSDQSISEDDLNEDCPEDHISLGNPAEKKGEVQILSQLDMLRDASEFDHERSQTSFLHKRRIDTCVEDDVEFPNFVNKDEITYTSAKASEADNHQEMNSFSSRGNRNGVCNWLAEYAEADTLVNVNDNSDCTPFHSLSSKLNRSSKGGQGKAKHKFSFRTQLHNDSLFKDSSDAYESHTSIKDKEMDGMTNHMMPAGFPVSHTHSRTSMAEILLRVQDEHDQQEGSTMNAAFNNQTEAVTRCILPTGHDAIDDNPDYLDSDSSEENEYNHQIQEVIMPESKQKTIADQFHDALGAASTNEDNSMYAVPQHTGFGLFGKLKRVMQSEKEKDSIFLNKLHKEDEAGCLDVKILSKTLEGKLTVCLCASIENDGSSTLTYNPANIIKRKNMTIIFSSRLCSDVELDVGTLVRLHSPWKEVNVNGSDTSVILSTYFSQI